MKTRVVLALVPTLVGVFLLNCSDPDLCEGPQCAPSNDAGPTGDATLDGTAPADGSPSRDGAPNLEGGGDGGPPVSCDTSKDISSQAACVTDSYAIFVNGLHGSDSGNGTKENAYKTIGAATTAGSPSGRIFVCATTYHEPVTITSNVSLYGGFDCNSWSYSTTSVPKVSPTTAGYALDVESAAAISIEDLEFDAEPGPTSADSSIGIFANAATVSFARVTVVASSAGQAPDGGVTSINYGSPTAPDGVSSSGGVAGLNGPSCPACLLETTPTSSGGESGAMSGAGAAGLDGGPPIEGAPGGAGGTYDNGCNGTNINGASTPAAAGGGGATSPGTLTAAGWAKTIGNPGGTAAVAQGGGGGAGSPQSAGGSGACGGCGGGGGSGGMSGASSVAVASYQSKLTFIACRLTASLAAGGAKGGDGQVGQSGGQGGTSYMSKGCQGGNGGNGGYGGGGGGGAGGLSVDILYVGTAPSIGADSTTTFSSTASIGGGPGANGSSAASEGSAGAGAATMMIIP